MHILITGTAGFIGFHLSKTLAKKGYKIYGIDSINDYYDVSLKESRLKECGIHTPKYGKEVTSSSCPNYKFCQADLRDRSLLEEIFQNNPFDCIINLAAQTGVRYSLTHPECYLESNISGFLNLLELSHKHFCQKLIYASSSSVYGNSTTVPFKEDNCTDQPVSIYAATKKSNELMAYTYSHLYGIQTIGLRFFTVYGPMGRPDMAPMLFANAIQNNETIKVFNNGDMARDFTYIDDIIEGIVKIIDHPEIIHKDTTGTPAIIYNIGHGTPVRLMDFIHILENTLNKTAPKEYLGMQPGDVHQTWADTTKLKQDYDYRPATSLEQGIEIFAQWFKNYYQK